MKSNFPKKQMGVSGAGLMLLVVVFGSILTVGMKLVPLYLDHNTMSNILDKMALEDGMTAKSDDNIKKTIRSRFKMNNIRDFDVHENVKVNRTRNGVEVIMDYEIRMNLVKNLDMIAAFDKSIELRN